MYYITDPSEKGVPAGKFQLKEWGNYNKELGKKSTSCHPKGFEWQGWVKASPQRRKCLRESLRTGLRLSKRLGGPKRPRSREAA